MYPLMRTYQDSSASGRGTTQVIRALPIVVTYSGPSCLLLLAHAMGALQIVLEGSGHLDYLLQMACMKDDLSLWVPFVLVLGKCYGSAESYLRFTN